MFCVLQKCWISWNAGWQSDDKSGCSLLWKTTKGKCRHETGFYWAPQKWTKYNWVSLASPMLDHYPDIITEPHHNNDSSTLSQLVIFLSLNSVSVFGIEWSLVPITFRPVQGREWLADSWGTPGNFATWKRLQNTADPKLCVVTNDKYCSFCKQEMSQPSFWLCRSLSKIVAASGSNLKLIQINTFVIKYWLAGVLARNFWLLSCDVVKKNCCKVKRVVNWSSEGGRRGELGSGNDKFNDDLRFTTALAWFSCVN